MEAKTGADNALKDAGTAKEAASNYADAAADSATAAATSETNAENSASAAAGSAEAAAQTKAEVGTLGDEKKQALQDEGTAQQAAIEKKGQDTLATIPENYTQTVQEVSQLKEDISNKITKFYASNQGETHLADSDNGKIMDMMLYGRCEQQTTTGKNLFDVTKTDKSVLMATGINVVKAERQGGLIEAVFSLNYQQLGIIIPEAERDTTYTIKLHQVNDKNDKIDIRAYTIKNNALSDQVKGTTIEGNIISMTFNIPAGTRSTVWFRPNGAYSAENKNACKFSNIQLEKGSEATSFEPYTGGIPSPNPEYPQEIKSVVNPVVAISDGADKQQTVTLPYTLNAIPVTSGGNITIAGQQYIADYVNVERGKLVRMVDSSKLDNTQSIIGKNEWLLAEPQEVSLADEEIRAFEAFATYYPVTNISVNSEQLDGYTVFNYPISMENGWNYVKQQIGDTRDYIYDMDTKTQDIDTQAAEAYVNSEYAVALTELEV